MSNNPTLASPQPGSLNSPLKQEASSYRQALRSTVLIGGSSLVRIGFGIVRTKAMALLLGPSGVGLLGLYNSIADLAQNIVGLGINTSGVRQIAEAVSTGDTARVARTVTTLRRVALVLALLGMVLLASLSGPVSRLSFGDGGKASQVAILACAVFFGVLASGQIALIQGMRRMRDLAWANVWGAVYGTGLSVGVVYWFGAKALVPSIVCVAGVGAALSWWFSRRIQVERVVMNLQDVSREVSALVKLGSVFMAAGLMSLGVAYLVRLIVLRQMGEADAGFYQAAWALGGLYVGFILQAMGADFFPRLTAAAADNRECNRLVNEQAEVSVLLAGPGILGTLTFAPLVIQIFYSGRFGPSVEILRWICLGMMLRVASWPMSFVLLAKGARQPYFWSEIAANLVQVVFVWFGIRFFGLKGTGIAFFGGYVFYWFLIYAIVRSLSGFRWSAANRRVGTFFAALIAAVFVVIEFLPVPGWMAMVLGGLATLGAGVGSLRMVSRLIPVERFPKPLRSILVFLNFIQADSKG